LFNQRISKEKFIKMIEPFGYKFDDTGKWTCKDGELIIGDKFVVCYNKVVYDDSKKFVKIKFPFESDDLDVISRLYVNDFQYFHSYECYKDFINIDTPGYDGNFISYILPYYVVEGEK
jgi:hypothetical protein